MGGKRATLRGRSGGRCDTAMAPLRSREEPGTARAS